MARKIITQSDIQDLLARGERVLQLGENDIVTALASDYALDQGVAIQRAGSSPAAAPSTAPASSTSPAPEPRIQSSTPDPKAPGVSSTAPVAAATPAASPSGSTYDPVADEKRIREAIISKLGYEPQNLDAAIAKVVPEK